ncbi:MAG: hypothetical protein DRQ44_06205 [Gammaproteobacteria bacterium]|nr:MAG: hypothetical protein DRQ44_06205 [Gammaproteobacteria bacterium]
MSRTCKIKLLLFMLISAAFTTMVTATEVGKSDAIPSTFEFRPGVIVDPDNSGVVYLMSPENGIESIDISSGTRIWFTHLAQKPLLLKKKLLIAQYQSPEQHNSLQIVGFEITAPNKAAFKTNIILPTDVQVSIVDSMESSFRINASISERDLVLHWSYLKHAVSGIDNNANDNISDVSKKGIVKVNLDSMQAVHFPLDTKPGQSEARLPDFVSTKLAEENLPGPVLYGERVIAVVKRKSANQGITLFRWDHAGNALRELDLFGHGMTYRYASADGRYLLASKRSDGAKDTHGKYLWNIHSVDTGKKLAELHNERVGAWFFVWGTLLFHEVLPNSKLVNGKWLREPLGLQAINIRTGAPLWFTPIRDLIYRGELPPEMLQSTE